MDDRLRRLQEALPGLTGDMPREFFRLAEVFLYDAFELSRESEPEGGEISLYDERRAGGLACASGLQNYRGVRKRRVRKEAGGSGGEKVRGRGEYREFPVRKWAVRKECVRK